MWETVDGGWVVEDGYRFPREEIQGQHEGCWATRRSRPTGASRRRSPFRKISAACTQRHRRPGRSGAPLAQGGIEVTQTFEMHPSEGPIGTLIELRVTGFGWRTMEARGS